MMQGGEVGLIAKAVAAYLLGGIMGGDLMRRWLGGCSLRDAGSGNVGASNALRTRGWKFALGVLTIDLAKGVLAVMVLAPIGVATAGAAASPKIAAALPYVCAWAAVFGHCYPAFSGFRGGRGVATAAGATIAAMPAVAPWMLGAFVMMMLLTGYASLASLAAASAVLVWVLVVRSSAWLSPSTFFAGGLWLLLLFTHRTNLRRLHVGNERRFERARLIGRGVEKMFDRMAGAWRAG